MLDKRRLARFLRWAEPALDIVGLLVLSGFFISYLPIDILRRGPATGGDMGSHFWPLANLLEHGIENFSVRIWNPGNLGGEPQLVHYFPFPFLVMATLAAFLPLGMAFNVGTLLPLLLLPISVYCCLRMLRLRFPSPLLGAVGSLFFLYNEGNSMFGGNTLSTLAGQFAHGYALVFLFLGIGALGREMRRGELPLWSALCFAAVATSHAYVLLGLPLFFFSFLLCFPFGRAAGRVRQFVVSGVVAAMLSLWFLVPMLGNAPWTTAVPMTWRFNSLKHLQESLLPYSLWPALGLSVFCFLLLLLRRRGWSKMGFAWFWLLPTFGYAVYYFVFPKLGLVDVRVVPQVQLFVSVLSGIMLAEVLRRFGRTVAWLLPLPLLIGVLWFTSLQTVKLSPWLEWNYSGWESKKSYPDLLALSDFLSGDFSDPRVVYEHSPDHITAGTTRVFEMLPYFAGRATLESLYTQATILSPMIYQIVQSKISKAKVCLFHELYDCPREDLNSLLPQLRLLGVGEMILVSDVMLKQARALTELKEEKKFGIWHVFSLREKPSLVDVPSQPFLPLESDDWKEKFYRWFEAYRGPMPYTLVRSKDEVLAPEYLKQYEGEACEPELTLEVNSINLKTPCPGRPHVIRVAYHPTWKSSGGERIHLVSPGFIALVPETSEISLRFGESLLWRLASIVSGVSFLALVFAVLWKKRRQKNGSPD